MSDREAAIAARRSGAVTSAPLAARSSEHDDRSEDCDADEDGAPANRDDSRQEPNAAGSFSIKTGGISCKFSADAAIGAKKSNSWLRQPEPPHRCCAAAPVGRYRPMPQIMVNHAIDFCKGISPPIPEQYCPCISGHMVAARCGRDLSSIAARRQVAVHPPWLGPGPVAARLGRLVQNVSGDCPLSTNELRPENQPLAGLQIGVAAICT